MAMIADPQGGPRDRQRTPGRGIALALAVLVHLAFLGVLIFSIRWQSHAPEPVSAELYAPIATQAPARATPQPAPKVEPAPPPEPVVAKPEPTPPPKPVAAPDRPDPQVAEIALKARAEAERKQRVEALRLAQEEEQKRVADIARQRELQKQLDDKKAADARARQQREMTQMQAQADKELQSRVQSESAARTKASADAASKSVMDDWIKRIQAKVRGNVLIPPDMTGNPEAIFEVVQLPTGEIIDAQLKKSSGVPAYDDAVQRAIIKSSPLPKPDRPEMFSRVLTLKFRPSD